MRCGLIHFYLGHFREFLQGCFNLDPGAPPLIQIFHFGGYNPPDDFFVGGRRKINDHPLRQLHNIIAFPPESPKIVIGLLASPLGTIELAPLGMLELALALIIVLLPLELMQEQSQQHSERRQGDHNEADNEQRVGVPLVGLLGGLLAVDPAAHQAHQARRN
jgi:hypothetical protein